MEDFQLKQEINNLISSQFVVNSTPFGFAINVIVVSLLSYTLGLIYIKFGRSLSNRAYLASTFPLLALATMSVITVVKSSLALSLGLVGALSIVRFRTPIKEPEELIYLFICISLGLAVGADQRTIAILILLSNILLVSITRRSKLINKSKAGSFTLFIQTNKKIDDEQLIKIVNSFADNVILKRFNGKVDSSESEICLDINIKSYSDIVNMKKALLDLSSEISIEIVDSSKVIGAI